MVIVPAIHAYWKKEKKQHMKLKCKFPEILWPKIKFIVLSSLFWS